MNDHARVEHPLYGLLPTDIAGYADLAELALDLRWSWNHAADPVWRQLDPELWDITRNAWVVLQTVSRARIERDMADPAFRQRVDELVRMRRRTAGTPAWFQQAHPESDLNCVAYFSMEFMLSEALPIYSGGLGNVAGDHLKADGDLGIPVVGVGLLYQQGYFRQVIDKHGEQRALYPYNDPGQLPITPLRDADGEWLRLEIALPGHSVWLRAWEARIGRTRLYLLDTNDAANHPVHRGITSELYGGGPELRITQELLLGIGGWRLLAALGLKPDVCHLNEGHAAFAVLERARSFMEESGQDFAAALAVTRAGNLFTTHTAVPAGFDRFAPSLVGQYLEAYATRRLGITLDELLALGRCNPTDHAEPFNMAYLAIRGCGAVNGVSRLHGQVSRRIFSPLFPRWPLVEVPVGHVTNGVHMPSWDSAPADALWTRACGKNRWLGESNTLERDMRRVPDTELWQFRTAASREFVDFARARLAGELAASGAAAGEVAQAGQRFDCEALTLGFARRFATYKRPNLLLHDPERLLHILCNPERPVQIVLAGKAHPADREGQALIREWMKFIHRPEARKHVIFLADYDMLLTEHLVQGVDVWINTPRRPWEACGTSGMKVLVNGGLNLSELDGWWAEAYTPEVGWALGDGREHGDDPAWDAAEAEALYDLLERGVVPEFYDRDEHGIPVAWVRRMRESLAYLTPRFSAEHMVREYTEQHYLPAAAAYRERAANMGAIGRSIADWQRDVARRWPGLRFGHVRVETRENRHVFEVELDLNGIDPDGVRVELFAEGTLDSPPVSEEMQPGGIGKKAGVRVYAAAIHASRPATDYTPRVIPHRDGVRVPLETAHIHWAR